MFAGCVCVCVCACVCACVGVLPLYINLTENNMSVSLLFRGVSFFRM